MSSYYMQVYTGLGKSQNKIGAEVGGRKERKNRSAFLPRIIDTENPGRALLHPTTETEETNAANATTTTR
jgi:hypothetical protein